MLARLLWRLAGRHDRDPHRHAPGEDPWSWACGFYPGCHPRECSGGTTETFEQARADFEDAWRVFLANRTEADFRAWREQRDWTAEKYRRFDRGERMPPDWRASG
jgi:hypothetical protein